MLYADVTLARRLELTEAHSNAASVAARAELQPASGAAWISVGGAYAMFDGIDSPLTQTFGLGMSGPVAPEDLAAIEAFFAERGAPVYHEVSPLADAGLLPLLLARGYQPFEYTTVLYQPLPARAEATGPSPAISTRLIGPDEVELWARTAAAGWADEHPGLEEFLLDFGRISAHRAGYAAFLAEQAGQPVGAGGLFCHRETALLAGASTVPAARRQGVQRQLLNQRLRHAAAHGCTVAMMVALPGSQSQRNAERQGFRVAYTRTKWTRPAPTGS